MKPADEAPLDPPKHEIEAFARCIYPAIQEYFESEEVQKAFAEWKQKQELERKKQKEKKLK